MGAGKSSFGKRLAKKMGTEFIDSDKAIEKETKMSIETIFESFGETHFRNIESNWLRQLSIQNGVVALGGGTPCFNQNIELIKKKGIIIYIDLPAKTLADRLLKSKTIRPLIQPFKNSRKELVQFIESTLEKREIFYKQADYVVSGVNLSSARVNELIDQLNQE